MVILIVYLSLESLASSYFTGRICLFSMVQASKASHKWTKQLNNAFLTGPSLGSLPR